MQNCIHVQPYAKASAAAKIRVVQWKNGAQDYNKVLERSPQTQCGSRGKEYVLGSDLTLINLENFSLAKANFLIECQCTCIRFDN